MASATKRRGIRPAPYYDRSRPASTGRWVATFKRSANFVETQTFHTEREARKAMRLSGGSKDPHYTGEGA